MEKLKKKRWSSFAAVFLIYVICTVVGVVSFRLLPCDTWTALLLADVIATVCTFIFSVILKNASVYDPYWSVQSIVISFAFVIVHGVGLLDLLLLLAVLFWGVRLTANWAYTFRSLEHQDWRYTMLKEKTGVFYPVINLVGIHLVPTLVVYGCTAPVVFALAADASPHPLGYAFLPISFAAVLLQGTADCQMHAFRKKGDSTFIRRGLWKYSRHPNYLGEILMWWGIALSVCFAFPGNWILLSGAVANTVLFLAVSIPLAEGRQSKKPGYNEYKKQTRMLLPIRK